MRFVWAVVAFVLAAVLIGAGIAQRTIFMGPDTQKTQVEISEPAPFVLIDGDVLRANPGAQTLIVRGQGEIFGSYGRTADMKAWLADSDYNQVTLKKSGDLAVEHVEAETEASEDGATDAPAEGDAGSAGRDPRGSDLWLDSFDEDNRLVADNMQLPEGTSLLIAYDGTADAPDDIVVSWPLDNSTPWAGPLMVAGGIVLLRPHRNMLRRLLELEVPEIANGAVEIKAIAREAGSRSKVAVAALRPGVDPVGSCVGMRGTRIQGIVNELNGEKIDVVEWSPDPAVFIANALSPAQVAKVHLYEDAEGGKTALVIVPDKQLSLAIGKEGQNARLAAKLTGWRIDIKSTSEAAAEMFAPAQPKPEPKPVSAEDLLARAEAILASRPSAEEPKPLEEAAALWLDEEELPPAEAEPAVQEDAVPVESAAADDEQEEEAVEEPAELDLLSWNPDADNDEFEPRSKPKGKDKRASLEFDEATGKLVVKRQRKPGRQRSEWDY